MATPSFLSKLPRRRTFTAGVSLAALSLALGIGPNVAVLSVLRSTVFHRLPYPAPEKLVAVQDLYPTGTRPAYISEISRWAADKAVFSAAGTFWPLAADLKLGTGGSGDSIRVYRVSQGVFDALGVHPTLGRILFDARPTGVLLSTHLWMSDFDADPHVVGRPVTLGGVAHTITGVMPPDFGFPHTINARSPEPDAWVPLAPTPPEYLDNDFLGIARLRTGVSTRRATELLTAQLLPQARASGARAVLVRQLHSFALGGSADRLALLSAATILLLILACSNAACLMLMRSETKRREHAIRLALGASERRLLLGQSAEAAALAVSAAILGLLLAIIAVGLIDSRWPAYLPRYGPISVEWPTIAAAIAIAIAAAAFATTVPHTLSIRREPARQLAPLRIAPGTASARLRVLRTAVVCELAIAIAIGGAAALVTGALGRTERPNPGFSAGGVLAGTLTMPRDNKAIVQRLVHSLIGSPADYPGQLALSTGIPGVFADQTQFSFSGAQDQPNPSFATYQAIAGPYLSIMRIPLLAGRSFSQTEVAGLVPACLIDARMASILNGDVQQAGYPNLSAAIGRLITVPGIGSMRVVGVVGDVRLYGFAAAKTPSPELYVPFLLSPAPRATLISRTTLSPNAASRRVTGLIAEAGLPSRAARLAPLSDRIDSLLAGPRFNSLLILSFGLIGCATASTGVYAITEYWTALRRRELAVRAAIGAGRGQLLGFMVKDLSWTISPGIAIGLLLNFLESAALASAFVGVHANDIAAYALGTGLVVAATLAAGGVACVKALRSDPCAELRRAVPE